jgi:DNA (cytosine-5)-methyltransferase 1
MSTTTKTADIPPLTAVSLFSGCGGFDWGAAQAGIKIIWANDINKYAAAAYKTILPNVTFNFGDIRDYLTFPRADILIGCYPCTGFSIGARRKAKGTTIRDLMETEGNFLYLEFLRALKQVQPKYFFVENVHGMVSAINGYFFQQQLQGFKSLGYKPQYKLLKATDYGAPQERKRIFIVGIRNDVAEKVNYKFPDPTHGPGTSKPYRTMKDVLSGMDLWPDGEYSTEKFHGHYLTRNRKRKWIEPSFTIVAHYAHVPLHPMGRPMKRLGEDSWELQGKSNRRLSWKECRILQCLPATLNPDIDLIHKYMVVGNAVPPVFAKALLHPIVEYERKLLMEYQ